MDQNLQKNLNGILSKNEESKIIEQIKPLIDENAKQWPSIISKENILYIYYYLGAFALKNKKYKLLHYLIADNSAKIKNKETYTYKMTTDLYPGDINGLKKYLLSNGLIKNDILLLNYIQYIYVEIQNEKTGNDNIYPILFRDEDEFQIDTLEQFLINLTEKGNEEVCKILFNKNNNDFLANEEKRRDKILGIHAKGQIPIN